MKRTIKFVKFYLISVLLISTTISASTLNPCLQPLELGRTCNFATVMQSMKRSYYFDHDKNCCSLFYYLGCGGNGNNFFTSGRCIKSCLMTNDNGDAYYDDDDIDATEESERMKADCLLPPEMGPCRALIQMWYYDPGTGTCNMFSYGGCQGNGNRFNGVEECSDYCKGVNNVTIATNYFGAETKRPMKKGMCSL